VAKKLRNNILFSLTAEVKKEDLEKALFKMHPTRIQMFPIFLILFSMQYSFHPSSSIGFIYFQVSNTGGFI
jgi:hypothetical protein